jgi:hypothetical protein
MDKMLQRTLLGFGLAAALGVLFLDWQLYWHVGRFLEDSTRAEELKILTLLMFGLAGLYSLLLLLLPSFGARAMTRETDRVVEAVQSQLRVTIAELRELKDQTEKLVKEHQRNLGVPSSPVESNTRVKNGHDHAVA